jgi:tRNA(Ile)-lysidine synthase
MRGTKKVADILTDRKIPAVFKDEVPLIADTQGIVWIPGFTIAQRVKITKSTKRVIRLRYGNN